MTLDQIKSNTRATYALNEITGALAQLDDPYGSWSVCITGAQFSPAVLCMLLFDERHIAENWAPISVQEATARIACARMKAVEVRNSSL